MIQFFFEDVKEIKIDCSTISWLQNLIVNEQKKLGKITYIFKSDEGLLKVNREFLQHDYYTDIITFDYVKGKTLSADIYVSLHRISENAQIGDNNFNKELHRVLAHGILHLCGYNDKTQEQQKEMTQMEDYYLTLL